MSQPHTTRITCHNHTQHASQYMSQPHTTCIMIHVKTTHNTHHDTCHNHTQHASQYMLQPHTTCIMIHVTTTHNMHHDTTHITIHTTKHFAIQVTTILLSVSGHLLKLTSTCMSTLIHVSETLWITERFGLSYNLLLVTDIPLCVF